MIRSGLYDFIQGRNTRSGREYGQVMVAPVACPPQFQLSEVLQRALLVADVDALADTALVPGLGDVSTSATWDDVQVQVGDEGEFVLAEGVNDGEGFQVTATRVRDRSSQYESTSSVITDAPNEELKQDSSSDTESVPNSNGKHARKRRYRAARKAKQFATRHHLPNPTILLNQLSEGAGSDMCVPTDVNLQDLPFASCGYQAAPSVNPPRRSLPRKLPTLVKAGYRVVQHITGQSQPIVDSTSGKIIAVVVGHPNDPSYLESAQKVFNVLETARQQIRFSSKESRHPRGSYNYVNYGISHGQGSKAPHWLACDHEEKIKELLANEHLIRLASFASYAFAMWAPRVYHYYNKTLQTLAEHIPGLKWTFWNGIWPCVTFNFGPSVCCLPHRDRFNLPFGWCSITALGNYDYRLGGHLVLHDLHLVIEFPPGSLILIPSALLLHSNTPIQKGESRMSFTQFCSGGIFRYVENGFICEEDLKLHDPEMYATRISAKKDRKQFGLDLWSTPDELLSSALKK